MSKSAIELSLAIDTVNTFPELLYRLSKKTNVVREHRNRFRHIGKLDTLTFNNLQPIVDDTPEGVAGLPKVSSGSYAIQDTMQHSDVHWYLVYQSPTKPTEDTPINCYLMPDKEDIPYRSASGGDVVKKCNPGTIGGRNDFPNAPYYFGVEANIVGSFNFRLGTKTVTVSLKNQYESLGIVQGAIFDTYKNEYDEPVSLKITLIAKSGEQMKVAEITTAGNYVSQVTFTQASSWVNKNGTVEYINAGATTAYLASYKTLDKTSPMLLKIIDLPYCPVQLRWSGSQIVLAEGMSVDSSNRLVLDHKMEFLRENFDSELIQEYQLSQFIGEHPENDLRELWDPKLLHSDFTTKLISYDSYQSEVRLEDISPSRINICPSVKFDYKQSSKMASDLGFKWNIEDGSYDKVSEYENVLLSTRDNEDVIFNNAYLDYIKTGYNYRKAKHITSSAAAISSAGAAIAGTWLSTKVVGAFLGTAAAGTGNFIVAAAIVSTVATAVNAIASEVNAHMDEMEKREQLKAQGTTIEGSNDLALFNWYSGNKLKYGTLGLPDSLKQKFDDLFYYCGYATNVQKQPNVNSRYWFNFLQCEAEWDEPVFRDQPNLLKWSGDFTYRLANGVTVYHNHNNV